MSSTFSWNLQSNFGPSMYLLRTPWITYARTMRDTTMLDNYPRWPPFPNPSFSPPSSPSAGLADPMTSPGHSPTDLQNHLYASFLQGSTADVALHVKGSWEAIYKLHRVVLIQAGFFRPMFTAGFSESRLRDVGKYGPDEITIRFDDPNITRPAFEICISRLYGGGPPLYIPSSLIPTPLHPLTRPFLSPYPLPPEEVPARHHLASPHFLLSLLATAVYLSIPAIAGQALRAILNTMGPTTVMRYLDFAIGKGIGVTEEADMEAAAGLQDVALMVKPGDTVSTSDGASIASRLQDINIDDETKEDPALSDEGGSSSGNEVMLSYFYGGISNKVGEAAACWLARWAGDILSYEEHKSFSASTSSSFASSTCVSPIWARGGLDPTWVRALLSSDVLFTRGERERYDMAKAAVELRRRSGINEEEEIHFDKLFTEGIHYMHMSMEDLMMISRDVSPTAGKPYVPLSHLRAALWDQSILRHQITSNPLREKDLGISIPTASLSSPDALLPGEANTSKPIFLIPEDHSERIGDSTGLEGASMDQLMMGMSREPKRATPAPTSERNFFGILAERQTAATCVKIDKAGTSKWTQYPPFRFGVEFWDVECLKEKTRMHSHTVWYAGSLYNAYVQVIRKKGVQLGVYLHRQSHIDLLPAFSVPHNRRVEQQPGYYRGSSLPSANTIHHSLSLPAIVSNSPPTPNRSTTPISAQGASSSPTTPTFSQHSTNTSPVPYPPQPYRDPRSSISAYFSISCCSATGSLITKLTSGPDVFAISQSWGWKSSSLKPEEYLELDEDGLPVTVAEEVMVGKEVSLRATVVIGVV